MEAHCVNLELKYKNQALKEGQHGQFSKVKSNEANIKHDIDVIETINIELKHKVAKLLKKNKTLKRHYKELSDSIKTTRAKTIEHTTSLIAKNDEYKAQLQEKGFAIAALKNELRKLTGNSVNTKFAKSSILGKPVLQPHRNQSVVRQPTAFKSERPRISKPRFASQVDVNNDLSKPVTTHYLPKGKESACAKPHHMIAPGSSRYSSNDMVHNHYLEEAKKKTQESGRNSRPSVMPSARSQSTANGSKPKPRINNQKSRIWHLRLVMRTASKAVKPCQEDSYELYLIIAGRGGGRTGGRSGDQVNGRIDGQGGQVGVQGSEVNDGVDRVLDFSTLISQQLRNLLPNIVAQVGDQGRGQGNGRNQNGDAINDNIRGDVRNAIGNNDRRGCTYKEFLACNPKEYDGKGGAVVYTRWIEKMESVQDMSGCGDKQKVKYTDGSFVGMALTWWNSQIRTLCREVAVGMSWDDFKVLMREEFCPSNEMQKLETKLWKHIMVEADHAAYTDMFHELARNGSIKKNPEKRGNIGEPSKDRNGRDDNKRTRTGNAFATTAYLVRREYMGATPKCTTCNYHHPPETPCRTCFNYNRPRHFARDCRVVHRNVNPINARNPTARACYECGSTDHFTAACPRLNQAQIPSRGC
ncbi:reverse transcriptase domain-containing protein [Tanacetum coccineum]